MKARALSTGGKYDQAVKVLSDALSNSADQRLYLERAEILLAQRSYPEAIADLNEANRISLDLVNMDWLVYMRLKEM